MIEFGLLAANDFGCIKHAELPLGKQGLMLVLGENRDTSAADSNGSGKSTLFKALSWVLFGRTVDGLKGDDVIRNKAKATTVSQAFVAEGEAYEVVRQKTRGKAETLKVYYSSGPKPKSLGARTLKDAQAQLEELLGLDWLAFRNTVLYGQGDILHFADPRTTDSQRKSVLTKVLRLERLDEARALARARKGVAVKDQGRLEGEIAVLEGQLETSGVGDLEASADRWDEERDGRVRAAKAALQRAIDALKEVDAAKRKLKAARRRLDDVGTILAEYAEQQAERDTKHDEWMELTGPIARLNASRSAYESGLADFQGQIDLLDEGRCPTCETPSTGLHVKRKLTALRKSVGRSTSEIERIDAELEAVRAERRVLAEEIEELDEGLEDKADWEAARSELSTRITKLEIQVGREPELKRARTTAKGEVERVRDETNPFRSQIKERRARAAAIRKDIETKRSELKAAGEVVAVNDFWVTGFGPSGLPSYLMDAVVPVVAERANRYLEILSDGDLRVSLDTLSELKGGGVRDKLSIVPTIEGHEGVPPSGGQLKKITLACDLALMDLLANREGAAVDLLLLDEVLDGLDTSGRARVMELLEHLRGHRSTIIVISHDPEIVEKFGKAVTVVKQGGIARIREAA